MNIVVTGGSGFIGSALVPALVARGHTVTIIDRRLAAKTPGVIHHRADLVTGRLKSSWFKDVDAIVHLAGVSIFSRWTRKYKAALRSSRIDSARNVADTILKLPKAARPRIIISASAIGYYGNTRNRVVTERDTAGTGFLARLCHDWEHVWDQYLDDSARFVAIRTGIVVDEHGGMLGAVGPLYRRGMGVILGSGRQWLSWISLDDLLRIYVKALEDSSVIGPINAVAPRPLRHKDFSRSLARMYGQRVRFFIPSWAVRLLLGQAADLVLYSQRVKPSRLLAMGYQYQKPALSYIRR